MHTKSFKLMKLKDFQKVTHDKWHSTSATPERFHLTP